MTPYYERQGITLYLADCNPELKKMQGNQFDLAIVDPPYGINAPNMQMGNAPNRKGSNQYPGESYAVRLSKGRLNKGSGKLKDRFLNKSEINWDNEKPDPEYFKELFRVSQNQIIWGGNYFPLPPTRGIILWDKLQPWDNFSQFEFAWSSFDCPAAKIVISNTGGNIKEYETKIHPTQKPVALYRWLLAKYAKPGDTILDTHLGSGSIVIACLDLGYPLTAFEMDEQYLEPAVKRIENYLKQPKMFKPINKTLNQGSLF